MSTSWNIHRHRSGKSMLEEIMALGFRWIELSWGINTRMAAEISKFVERGKVRISSLYNFHSASREWTNHDLLQFTSHRGDQRQQAIHLTQQTIDYAARLGASCVILLFGRVGGLHSYRRLRRLALQGKLYTKEFARAKIREILLRERHSDSLKERAVDCLLRLGDYASARGIRLGIENRKAYEAFPSERELLPLLERLGHPTFGYWHNFGCSQVKEHLTLINHREWLDRVGSWAIGSHVCDVRGLDNDNLLPFSGTIDYPGLVPFLPDSCMFVLDLKGVEGGDAVQKSVERWKGMFSSRSSQ
ncbi:MAG: TIM barrel protein [Candidatus Xiphinematobacter sp.]|nr:MAG: TIM barrel protein [Candidatus Xiphinematobacter sp.]